MENSDKAELETEKAEQLPVTAPKKNSKLKMFGITLASLVVIAAAWYFLYFTKTPEYAVNRVRESIVKHDVATFKKHVDLDSLLGRAFEDMIAALIASDPKLANDSFSRSFVEGLAKIFKGMVVSEGKDGILRYVETGKWERPDDPSRPAQGGKSPAPSVKDMTKNTGLNDASFKGIAYSKQDGNTANIGAKIFLNKEKREFVLDVKMRKLADGSWQISEISNLKDFILEAEKARKATK